MKTTTPWSQYFAGPFLEELKALPDRFPSKFECDHCRAPAALRVLISQEAAPRDRLAQEMSEDFVCCWYGLVLVAQTLHRHFPLAYERWVREVFCPLPVVPVGMGCVSVAPPGYLLSRRPVSRDRWRSFSSFFNTVILASVETATGITVVQFLDQARRDLDRQAHRGHSFEKMIIAEPS